MRLFINRKPRYFGAHQAQDSGVSVPVRNIVAVLGDVRMRTAQGRLEMLIKIPRGREIREPEAVTEAVYMIRRQLLMAAGFLSLEGLVRAAEVKSPYYPAKRNGEFTLDRNITEEWAATGYNNFYEFDAQNKEAVKDKVGKFVISPWKVDVGGLVNKPQSFDMDDILKKFPLEERLYRHRCVERRAMAGPLTAFPRSL